MLEHTAYIHKQIIREVREEKQKLERILNQQWPDELTLKSFLRSCHGISLGRILNGLHSRCRLMPRADLGLPGWQDPRCVDDGPAAEFLQWNHAAEFSFHFIVRAFLFKNRQIPIPQGVVYCP